MTANASGFQTIQRKIHAQKDFGNDFQTPIKLALHYVPSSDPFEDFKKDVRYTLQ
jgi:hypothetical protein